MKNSELAFGKITSYFTEITFESDYESISASVTCDTLSIYDTPIYLNIDSFSVGTMKSQGSSIIITNAPDYLKGILCQSIHLIHIFYSL
jgi:hypothetical protein